MSPTDDNKPESEKPGEKARKRRPRRRPATIDLAATEVTVETTEPDKAESGAPETPQEAAREAPGEAETVPEEAKAAEEPEAEGKAAGPAKLAWTRNMSLALVIFAVGAALGGLVALGAYGGLVRLGLMPGTGRDVAPVEAKIDALRTDMDGEIAALKAALPDAALRKLAGDVQQLAERLKAVEGTLAQVPKEDPAQRLAAVDDRLGVLAARLGDVENAAKAGREEVRGLIEKMAASGDSQAATAAIAALTDRITAVEGAARAETARQVASLRAETRGQIETRMAEISREIAGLRSDMSDLRATIAARTSEAPAARAAAALAIAVAGLERAVNSGVSFARELATVEALTGPRDEITALKAYAETGVERRDALSEDFQDAASAAMSAGVPQANGFLDRLMADARRIVRIRPTGEVEGETTGAILARAETRLAAGDLAAAVGELASLDPAAKAAMAGWLERAKARLEAERLLAALDEQVLTGLSPGKGTSAQ